MPVADTALYRLSLLQEAIKYQEAYIFADKNRVLYNMKGNPVWFLPNIPGIVNESANVRDLKLSPRGTITFIVNNMPCEINYDAAILWKAPDDGNVSGDSTERYHHDFTLLQNGHYMVLGNKPENLQWQTNAEGDSILKIITDAGKKTRYSRQRKAKSIFWHCNRI